MGFWRHVLGSGFPCERLPLAFRVNQSREGLGAPGSYSLGSLGHSSSWRHQGFASSTLGLTEEVGHPELSVPSGASFSEQHPDGACSSCGHGKYPVLKSTVSTAQRQCQGPGEQGHGWLSPHCGAVSLAWLPRGPALMTCSVPQSPEANRLTQFWSQGPALLTAHEARPQSRTSKQRPPPAVGLAKATESLSESWPSPGSSQRPPPVRNSEL